MDSACASARAGRRSPNVTWASAARCAIAPGEYRVEGQGNNLRVVRDGRRFTVTDPDGTHYYFGLTSAARQQDDQGNIFAWLPELAVHRSGASIEFQYLHHEGQVYLERLRWGPGRRYDVVLEYEPRHDPVVSYREGLRVATALRLADVRVRSLDGDGATHELRAYHLRYDESRSLSRLLTVDMTGYEGAGALPTLTFQYADPAPTTVTEVGGTGGWRLEQRGVALFDVDGDGADDLVRLEMGNHEYRENLGGTFGPRTQLDGATALELENTAFIDLDGDARPELVRVVDDTWRYSKLVDGRWQGGWTWPGTRGVPLHGPGAVITDVNGDGRMDVVEAVTGGVRWRRNTPAGLAAPVSLPPIDPSNALIEPGADAVRLIDVNGDGLADAVWLAEAWMKVFLGRGDGTFAPWRRTFYPWDASDYVDLRDLRLADLDRDGLLDLVRFTAGHVLLFRGLADGSFDWHSRHVSRPEAADADVTVAIADANGNGSRDIVWSSPRGMWVLDLAGATSAGMLSRIDNGLGKTTTFTYRASAQLAVEAENAGQPWESKLPTSVPVPVAATVDVGDGSPLRTVHYGVRDGFWDGVERRFGGFLEGRKAIASDAAADVSYEVTRFHPGLGDERVLRGKPTYARLDNGLGEVHTETFTKWAAFPVDYGVAVDEPRLRVAVTRETRTRSYEGVAEPIDTLTWYEHDGQARVIAEETVGRTDLIGDESRKELRYAGDDDQRWVRNRVCLETVVDPVGRELSKTRTRYGGVDGPVAPPCELGDGLVRRTEGWLADDATPRWVTLSATTYTPHFNPHVVYGGGVTRTFGYDDADFRLRTETVSPDGSRTLTWTMAWDDVRGLATGMVDPNGQLSRIDYDALDRPTGVAQGAAPAHIVYQYDWTAPLPLTRTFVFDGDEGMLAPFGGAWLEGRWRESVAVANGAGESVLAATRFDSATWIVSGVVERDHKGRTTRMFDAFYYDGADLRAATPPADTPAQTFAYDGYDRLREQRLPTGGRKWIEYSAFCQVNHADELDPVSSCSDGAGRITRTERTVDGVRESVDATYDAAGRMLAMTLQKDTPKQTVHEYRYDSLGRMTFATDPDIGDRDLLYDDRGWLLEHTNGAGQTVSYGYDDIGRLTGVTADDGSSFAYHYDVALDAATYGNTAGRLAWVEEPTGRVQLGYDSYGRQVIYARSIDGQAVSEVSRFAPSGLLRGVELDSELGFRIDYDPAGRPVAIVENGSVTPYGDLWRVPNPRWDLDAAGRIRHERYGNGLHQGYELDDNGAPSRIGVMRPGRGGPLYDVAVTRNAWRGITSVTDGDGFGLVHDATFTYDGAARLTDATVGRGERTFAFSYRYDGLQNMVQRAASGPKALGALTGTYEYGGARPDGGSYGPRQLTRISDPADPAATVAMFDYDRAGRQIQRDGKTLVYNGLDQLIRVDGIGDAGDGAVTHAYGYDGLRVKTTSASGEVTRWFTPSILERGGERLHYVKLGDRIIARIAKVPVGAGGPMVDGPASDARHGGVLIDVDDLRGGLLAAGLLLIVVVAWRTRRGVGAGARPWIEVTAAVAVVAVVQAGCGMFGSTRQYAWSNGEVLYFHHGYAAGPVLITRADGSVYAERQYEPFGEEIYELRESPGGGTLTVGDIDYRRELHNALNKPADPDTGWSYHGARWMAPETARWLTPDPPVKAPDAKFMAEPWGLHPYQYVEQNPVAYWDPDGEEKVLVGYVYRIESGRSTKEWYVGSTTQKPVTRRLNSRHPWHQLWQKAGSKVMYREVYADLAEEQSSRGTLRSAKGEAVRSVEQPAIEDASHELGEAGKLNIQRAAAEGNAPVWASRHSVVAGAWKALEGLNVIAMPLWAYTLTHPEVRAGFNGRLQDGHGPFTVYQVGPRAAWKQYDDGTHSPLIFGKEASRLIERALDDARRQAAEWKRCINGCEI